MVIGEGGSGGALAMAVANEVWMLENAIYSILSPEGFASILWKDSAKAADAAKVMKITAKELKETGPDRAHHPGGRSRLSEDTCRGGCLLHRQLPWRDLFEEYEAKTVEDIVQGRYDRFRRM